MNMNPSSVKIVLTVLYVFTIISSILVTRLSSAMLPAWSWDTVPLWADFGVKTPSLLTDDQSEFASTHYQMISLEKCLGNPGKSGVSTETSFYKIAKQMRTYATNNETAIIFYWNIGYCFCDCYDITSTMCANQSMYFKDDYGNPVYDKDDKNIPVYDQTQAYVRQWWVDSLVSILKGAFEQGIMVNGVFADGTCSDWYDHTDGNVSHARMNAFNEDVRILMNMTRNAFKAQLHEYNPNLIVLGNGLNSYHYDPTDPHCMKIVPFVDGVLIEHFGAFEEVQDSKGTINATDILTWFQLTQEIVQTYHHQKYVFVKAWIGPETTPIDSMGPSWPANYYMQTPSTHEGIANASLVLLDFPLAAYLCGMATEGVYFNYAWWYDVTQGYVPCPSNVDSCDCPAQFYPQFAKALGPPKSDGVLNGFKCQRAFEHADVFVDVSDASSAVIAWAT